MLSTAFPLEHRVMLMVRVMLGLKTVMSIIMVLVLVLPLTGAMNQGVFAIKVPCQV